MHHRYKEIIEEKITSLKSYSQQEQFAQLMAYKVRVTREFDRRLVQLQDHRDLIRVAIARRLDLRKYHVRFFQYFTRVRMRHILSTPFIYSLLPPAILLHLFLEIYHRIGFRLYHIPRVSLRDHIVFDRGYLSYLNWFEKMNCIYCSYFNGLISYAQEIAGRTERYWCPIKHAKHMKQTHSQQQHFVEYLDARGYRARLEDLRDFSQK